MDRKKETRLCWAIICVLVAVAFCWWSIREEQARVAAIKEDAAAYDFYNQAILDIETAEREQREAERILRQQGR